MRMKLVGIQKNHNAVGHIMSFLVRNHLESCFLDQQKILIIRLQLADLSAMSTTVIMHQNFFLFFIYFFYKQNRTCYMVFPQFLGF